MATWIAALEPDSATFADLAAVPLQLQCPGAKPEDLPECWHALWDQSCAKLRAFLEQHPATNLLGYLYWRFGR